MPEDFQINEESRERAKFLTDQLSEYVDFVSRGPRPNDFEAPRDELDGWLSERDHGAPIDDVLDDTHLFARIAYFARRAGTRLAGMAIPEVGTVPVLDFQPPEIVFPRRPLRFRRDGYVLVEASEALAGFAKGLELFLSYRFAGFRFWQKRRDAETGPSSQAGTTGLAAMVGPPPSPGSVAPGGSAFYVRLTCVHYRLATYASPAYALTWRSFGSLTTPSDGALPPGAWIFGAQGGAFRHITPDPTPVHIPPLFTPCTNLF